MIQQAYVLEKLVKDFDTMKLDVLDGSDADIPKEEDIPPLPESILTEKPLTPEEEEAQSIYENAMLMLNRTKPDKKQAYNLLSVAADKGNREAKVLVGWAKLFGNPIRQNVEEAREIFSDLAEAGNPDGHMGLGKNTNYTLNSIHFH